MTKFLKLGIVCVCIQLSCVTVWAADKIAPFTLSDKKDVAHSVQFPNKKSTLIIVADKNSSSEAKLFGEDLNKALGEKVDFVTIAAVGSVPGFMKGSIKGNVKGNKLTLLDWDNKVSAKLGYHEKKCLILVVDVDGTVLAKTESPYSKDKVTDLVAKLAK